MFAESASRLSVKTSTFFFSCFSFSLCATPNRCSSSTTTSPIFGTFTSFERIRCVPINISTSPFSVFSTTSFCSFFERNRDNKFDLYGKRGKSLFESFEMLIRKNRRRRQNRDLFAVHHGFERGAHCDLGFAVTDIADDKPVHRNGGLHILFCIFNRARLIDGQLIRKRVFKFLLPRRIARKSKTLNKFAFGIKPQKFVRHVAHRAFRFRLGFLPADAAEPVERRRCRFAGRITRNKIKPFDGNKKFRIVGVDQAA